MKKNLDLSDMLKSALICMQCGKAADLLSERKFICDCGGLYDVEHDFIAMDELFSLSKQLPKRSLYTNLVERFNYRAQSFQADVVPQYSSGVWRFKELIMPFLPDEYIVTLGEGKVPIVPAGLNLSEWVGAKNLWLILEGMTPTGSFKDFGMTVMISVAKAAGIKSIGCASTGDTSASLSAYAAAAGMRCSVVLPEGQITAVQVAQLVGSNVITLPGPFDECMRVVRDLVAEGLLFPANSLNPTRIEGHQATVFLIAQAFNWVLPDWIAVPVGNGSNCSSVGKALRLLKRLGHPSQTSRILGSQSLAANPLSHSWTLADNCDEEVRIDNWQKYYSPRTVGETTATAARIGNPVSYAKVMREITQSNGIMNTVGEKHLNEAVTICGQDGYSICPQTGIALAGVKLAIAQKRIDPEQRIVVVSTATGLKFTESAAESLQKTIIKAPDCRTETVAKIISRGL